MALQNRDEPPSPYHHPIPAQPEDSAFLRDLTQPLHGEEIRWERSRPRPDEVSLAGGVTLDTAFPDPEGVLETAYQDFGRFLHAARIPTHGEYAIEVRKMRGTAGEFFRIEVGTDRCLIQVGDTEGVRRALVFLEDELLRSGGPFLPVTRFERAPVIRRRIMVHVSMFERLGFDTLPDEYLNRLAHEGVNGVMLAIERIYPHRIVPEFGAPPEALFQTLRKRVQRYARYGIKLFLYLNEPKAFPAGDPLRAKYPHLLGGDCSGLTYFCTGTREGCRAVSRGFQDLMAGAPGLGGLIVICVGERPTHCYSAAYESRVRTSRCPRCSKRAPRDVLRDTLAAMERGVHAADPRAEFIAWPYSQYLCWGERLTRDAAGHVPPNVILMHNFDSAAKVRQLGKIRRADDYWLSVPGPSDLFRACARTARKQGTTLYAKIMTGCSHELASVPYVPIPGNLFRRFTDMHALGVSGALQNWSSGNDPSLMNRAAGDLAFAPLPQSEQSFLENHARRDWGRQAPTVVRAWKHFRAAFDHCPVSIGFSYFGPLHNGPVWPLYLEPRRRKLGGNWRPDHPGGDLIGDCTGYHTLDELIRLCTRLRDRWARGVQLMETLLPAAEGNTERQEQIGLAQALALHFESAVNILTFYALRERLARARPERRRPLLDDMRAAVRREIEVDRRLLPLASRFPRLGFCPEAGVYKYFPEMIRWRMRELETLLATEFRRVARRLKTAAPLFPDYTGEKPEGYVYRCSRMSRPPQLDGKPDGDTWELLPEAPPLHAKPEHKAQGRTTTWRAGYDDDALYLGVRCREPRMDRLRADPKDPSALGPDDQVHLVVQSSPFDETRAFMVNALGAREYYAGRAMNDVNPRGGEERLSTLGAPRNHRWTARATQGPDYWALTVRIPFPSMGLERGHRKPLRFSLARASDLLGSPDFQTLLPPPAEPGSDRLGWLVFEP